MHRIFLVIASVFAATGVALGAFGAHGLEKLTTNEKILHGFQTGVSYQLYHALALIATGILFERIPGKMMNWAGTCFITGILFFSGSLYALTFLKIRESSAIKIVGPITPVGGLLFIAGWLLFLFAVMNKRTS
jgi:uncharacterized membrane protein YgdD (TMEM256/DUF423 family)